MTGLALMKDENDEKMLHRKISRKYLTMEISAYTPDLRTYQIPMEYAIPNTWKMKI